MKVFDTIQRSSLKDIFLFIHILNLIDGLLLETPGTVNSRSASVSRIQYAITVLGALALILTIFG
jgi:hypothetical protein